MNLRTYDVVCRQSTSLSRRALGLQKWRWLKRKVVSIATFHLLRHMPRGYNPDCTLFPLSNSLPSSSDTDWHSARSDIWKLRMRLFPKIIYRAHLSLAVCVNLASATVTWGGPTWKSRYLLERNVLCLTVILQNFELIHLFILCTFWVSGPACFFDSAWSIVYGRLIPGEPKPFT